MSNYTPILINKEKDLLINLAHVPADLDTFLAKGYTFKNFRQPINSMVLKLILAIWEESRVLLSEQAVLHIKNSKNYTDEYKASAITLVTELLLTKPYPLFVNLLSDWEQEVILTDVSESILKYTETISEIRSKSVPLVEGLNKIQTDLKEILNTHSKVDSIHIVGQDPQQELAILKARQYSNLIPTGFPTFDKELRGLSVGLNYIFGPQKHAKSLLVGNIAEYALKLKKRVFFFVNEGGIELVKYRLASKALHVPFMDFNTGIISPENETRFIEYITSLKGQFFIDSHIPTESNTLRLRNELERIIDQYGKVDLVVTDTFTYMQSQSNSKNRWEALDAIAAELSGLALDYDIPIIAVGHATRSGGEEKVKELGAEHMAGSIGPTRNAVMYASWKIEDFATFKKTGTGFGNFNVLGCRTGPAPSMVLRVDANFSTVEEISNGPVMGVPISNPEPSSF